MTFTPKGRRHWSYSTFFRRVGEEDIPRPNTALIQAHTSENPFLPDDYAATIAEYYSSAMREQELAGRFVDLMGLMFQRHWFQLTDTIPTDAVRIRYWDKAATEGAGAYSCGVLMSRTERGRVTVEDVVRGQWSWEQRNTVMLQTAEADAEKWGNTVVVYFEQEPGSGGKESAQQTIRMLSRFPCYRDIVSGVRYKQKDKQKLPGEAKVVRARPYSAQCEAGNVYLRRASWVGDYLDELTAFPEYAYADQVDGSSGAYNKLASRSGYWNEPPSTATPTRPDAGDRFGLHYERHDAVDSRDSSGGRRTVPWEKHR
jgi:predicted phage terminase large subunit-like protein